MHTLTPSPHTFALCAAALALCLTAGCRTQKPDALPLEASTVDGQLRVEQPLAPVHYTLDLSVDPVSGVSKGSAVVLVDVKKSTRTVIMHAEGLKLGRVLSWEAQSPRVQQQGLVTQGKNGAVVLRFPQLLHTGRHAIQIDWSAPIETSPRGLYRVQDGGNWYAFTQFEPLEARRAFPCFDEPRYKSTYDVTLRVHNTHMALTNTPQLKATPLDAHHTAYTFATSKPMPTYLVAWAVGPFDVLTPKEQPEGLPPMRIIAPKGKAHLGAYALKHTPAILKDLEAYFGQPYPYAKLDLVAVPDFDAGAMENIGLVTFRERLLLVDEQKSSMGLRYAMRSVMAHELAHMWFGNLVTPRWWDDLWLNESFATWMASRVMARTGPEFDSEISAVRNLAGLMNRDSMPKTRAIRQPIATGGDIYNAFDGMTYSKGARVLRMIEAWIGAKPFQQGVRAFIKANANATATTKDLLTQLDRASGEPVSEVISTFLDQPGVPQIKVATRCEQGATTVDLSQTRYVPQGMTLPETSTWKVPMCFALIKGAQRTTHCEVLTQPTASFKLPGDACYDMIYPNADVNGYYLWDLEGVEQWSALVKTASTSSAMTPRERLALYAQLSALSEQDPALLPLAYDLSLGWARSGDMRLVERSLQDIKGMRSIARKQGLMPQYNQLVRSLYRPVLDTLGLQPREQDTVADRSVRRQVIGMLGQANDAYILANAQTVLQQFLSAPDSVPEPRASWALALAARPGDEALWSALLKIASETKSPAVRAQAIRAMASIRDPALSERTWGLVVAGTLRSSEMWSAFGGVSRDEATYERFWTWMTANYDPLLASLGGLAERNLPYLASAFCTTKDRDRVRAFFATKLKPEDAGTRTLNNALTRIEQCERSRAKATPVVRKILSSQTLPAPTQPPEAP